LIEAERKRRKIAATIQMIANTASIALTTAESTNPRRLKPSKPSTVATVEKIRINLSQDWAFFSSSRMLLRLLETISCWTSPCSRTSEVTSVCKLSHQLSGQ